MKTRDEIARVNKLFREAREKGEPPPLELILDWDVKDIDEAIRQSRKYIKQVGEEIRDLKQIRWCRRGKKRD